MDIRRKGMWTSLKLFALVAIGIAAVAVCLPGCESWQVADQRATESMDTAANLLESDRAYWQDQYNQAVATGDSARAGAADERLTQIDSASKDLGTVRQQVDEYKSRVTDADGNFDPEKGLREASALVPYPFSLILGIAAPFVAAGVQQIRLRQAVARKEQLAKEIVASVDAARKENPIIADSMKDSATQTAMWEAMTPETYEFINTWRNT